MSAIEESRVASNGRAHVRRPRLERLVAEVPPGGTALVVAPAGSGKTVLLRQWAARTGGSVAWLSVEAAHDDPSILAEDLWTSCAAAVAGLGHGVPPPPPRGPGLGRRYLDALSSALAEADQPILLILDDAHHLSDPSIVEDLGRFLRRLPLTVRAVVASRWDPALPMSALRLEGLVEVRASDLSFDVDEATALVTEVVGRPLTADLVTALVDRTDGWSAGLHLASVSIRRTDDPSGFVARFAGDDSLVAEYLTEEVLRHEDADTRRFLLRTSVLDELDPDLCSLVSGQATSNATIDDLERRGLFVVRASTGRERRYHHLFARLLRYRLRAEDPDGEREAREAAAGWHVRRGEIRQAVEQRLAAEDTEGAFELISRHGYKVFASGGSATLVRWLTRIADAGTEPTLDVLVNLLAAQAASDQHAAAEETYRRLLIAGELPARHRASAQALHAASGLGELPIVEIRRTTDDALAALEAAGDEPAVDFLGVGDTGTLRAIAEYMRGHADLYEGNLTGAKRVFERALDLSGSFPIWRIASIGALAATDALLGLDRRAEEGAIAAVQQASEVGAEHHVTVAMSHLALAIVRIDRLDTAGARRSLDDAALTADQSGRPFLHHLHSLQEARLAQLTTGTESMIDRLRSPDGVGTERPVAHQMRVEMLARALVRLERLGEARTLLSTAADAHPLAQADERLASGAFDEARELLDRIEPDLLDLRTRIELDIRRALVVDASGEAGRAGEILAAALESAEHSLLHAPFVESPRSTAILRTAAPRRVAALVDRVIDEQQAADTRDAFNRSLVEPLTDRELGILEYLPSRLTNTEIAGTLYISVNTLKTHLRNIYRKLDAADRDAAVVEASKLGLL